VPRDAPEREVDLAERCLVEGSEGSEVSFESNLASDGRDGRLSHERDLEEEASRFDVKRDG
jgi:hypothetical protein